MADYSRDTFRLTNVLHQLLDQKTVDDPRNYVGVRMQQGVPLLDSDWNEADDLRRREVELLVRDFIGDGVPGLGPGFSIEPLEADNDFAILAGPMLLGGWQVINPALIRYGELAGVPALTTPAGDRVDVVYLDVWESETGSSGTDADERLLNETIGVETTVRIERRWTIRVAEGSDDFDALALNEPGHKYAFLARLFRSSSPRVQDYMIEDQRRLGLTLADGLKTPMLIRRGSERLEPDDFSNMLAGLRRGLRFWQESALFPIVISTLEVLFAFQNAINEVYNLAAAAEVASDAKNLDNQDGLAVLRKLVAAQRSLLAVIRQFGTGVPSDMEVVDFYEAHLDGDPARSLDGIQPALDLDDLLGAAQGQETLNVMLLVTSSDLPAGDVSATLSRVDPPTAIAATVPFTITYDVGSQLLTPASPELFDLEMVVSDVRWAAALDMSQIMLAPGATGEVQMTVTPSAGLGAGEFADINLVARANRRPTIVSVQPAQRFTIGQVPPGETFFFYSGGTPLAGGILEIARAEIEETIFEIQFTLANTTGGAQTHSFRLEWELAFPATHPAGVDPSAWIPNAAVVLENQTVAGASTPVIVSLRAPSLAAVTENIDITLNITATLTGVNGAPIGDAKTSTIALALRVDMTA